MAEDTIEVNDANFDAEVLQATEPVLVDFWAPWCGPCRMLAPVIHDIATEYAGRAKVVKLNTEDGPTVAGKFGIQAIPTLLVFKGGEVVDRAVGLRPKQDIAAMLDNALAG